MLMCSVSASTKLYLTTESLYDENFLGRRATVLNNVHVTSHTHTHTHTRARARARTHTHTFLHGMKPATIYELKLKAVNEVECIKIPRGKVVTFAILLV